MSNRDGFESSRAVNHVALEVYHNQSPPSEPDEVDNHAPALHSFSALLRRVVFFATSTKTNIKIAIDRDVIHFGER
jgi:hypothetical protein